jgi:hypothetical protein
MTSLLDCFHYHLVFMQPYILCCGCLNFVHFCLSVVHLISQHLFLYLSVHLRLIVHCVFNPKICSLICTRHRTHRHKTHFHIFNKYSRSEWHSNSRFLCSNSRKQHTRLSSCTMTCLNISGRIFQLI